MIDRFPDLFCDCDACSATADRRAFRYDARMTTAYDPPLDPGIAHAVEALRAAGIETFESCQGGAGHAYPEPTVRFYGDRFEGYLALAAAMRARLPVTCLRRVWPILEGDLSGPWWEMTFTAPQD